MELRSARVWLQFVALALALGSASPGSACSQAAPADGRPGSPSSRAPRFFEGARGGPFAPVRESVVLRNESSQRREWKAVASVAWLGLAQSEGTCEPDGAATLELFVTPAATALAPGCHFGTLAWTCGENAPTLLHVALAVRQDGWTELTPSADSRRVFVSSSGGDDFHDGLSEGTAKRSLAAAIPLLRHGHPDWLLLKRGDTWRESLGHWKRSGRSASEPMVVTSYGAGGERPRLLTGVDNGLITLHAGDAPPRIDYLALVGLHMHADAYVGGASPSAVAWLAPTDGVLIEDCFLQGYEVDIRFSEAAGRKRNVRIRRNVIVDAFATEGVIGHGLFLAACDELVLEENVIDRNGFNPAAPDALPTIFRHGVYVQSGVDGCTNVLVRGNIISDNSSHGLQLRPGGIALDNLFLRNPIALLLGGGLELQAGGAIAVAHRNVILSGRDIDAENPRGWGLGGDNLAAATITENIIAFGEGGLPVPLALGGEAQGVGVLDTLLRGNLVHDWGGSSILLGAPARLGPLWLEQNVLRNTLSAAPLLELRDAAALTKIHARGNRFESAADSSRWMAVGESVMSVADWRQRTGDWEAPATAPAKPAKAPTIEAYMASLGEPATAKAFLAAARAQSRSRWDPRFTAAAANAFVRSGFGMR